MSKINRRTFVSGAAATGAAVATGAVAASAKSSRFAAPAIISAQNAPVEITFYNIWGTPPGGEVSETKHPVDQVIDAFNEQSTDIKVTGETPGGYQETLQKVQAQLAAGDAPALVTTPWASINYAYEGLGVVALEDIAGDEVAEVFGNLKDQVIPLVQTDGKTIGLPYAFSCPIFYYNNDILTEAGVDPAALLESWDSFGELGAAVQEATGNPIFGEITNADWPAQSIIQSNGGLVMDENLQPVMDGPESVAAMQKIADLDTAGLYDHSTSAERRASFLGGSLATIMGSVASLGSLSRNAAFDLQTSPFPVFTDKARMMSSGGSFIGVYAQEDEQRQAAWEFLKFAISEEGYSIWMQTGYLNASKYDLPILEGQEAAYTQLDEGLTRETPWPTERGAELQDIWRNYVARIWMNDIEAEEGCKAAVEEINLQIG